MNLFLMKWVIMSAVRGTNRHIIHSTNVIERGESVVHVKENVANPAAEMRTISAAGDSGATRRGVTTHLAIDPPNYLPTPGKLSLPTLSVGAVPPATGWRVILHVVYVIVSPLTLVSNLSISLNLR